MQYKLKHRLSAALMAGAMCCTMIPAASAEEISTPEIADTFVPEITDSVTPDLSQITENLYNDLPDAPTGSYLGSMGLPVATGETKISISAWVSDLYDGTDAHMDADALNGNESTVIVGRNPDADYAVVPLLVQADPDDAAFQQILDKAVAGCAFDYGVDVTTDDHILTLSTCTADPNSRLLVVAKLIDGGGADVKS